MLFKNKYKDNWEIIKNYVEIMIEYNISHARELIGDENPNSISAMENYESQRIALSDVLVKMKKLEREL